MKPQFIWLVPPVIVVLGLVGFIASTEWWVLSIVGAAIASLLILGDVLLEKHRRNGRN